MTNINTYRFVTLIFFMVLVNCSKLKGNVYLIFIFIQKWESAQGWKILTRFAFDSIESSSGVIKY